VTPLAKNAVLLVVDVQRGFDGFNESLHRNNPDLEANIARLLDAWRRTKRPIIYVQHLSRLKDSPLAPGQPGVDIKDAVRPRQGEPIVQKSVNSAFIGTSLEADLRAAAQSVLVVTGVQTNMCVSTTARMAGNLGFETWFIADATATHARDGFDAETMHRTALASLDGEFAHVMTTADAIQRLHALVASP
jgi:nicotinamidase-related amidase